MLDGVGTGNLCRLREQNHYGRELPVATVLASREAALVKWLKKAIGDKQNNAQRPTFNVQLKIWLRGAESLPMNNLRLRSGRSSLNW